MTVLANTRIRAERLMDERVKIQQRDESLVAEINARPDGAFTDAETDMRTEYRNRTEAIDSELALIAGDLAREEKSAETSKAVRGHLAGHAQGVTLDGDEVVYRTFSAYARDRLIRDRPEIRTAVERQFGPQMVQDASERLNRAVAHTVTDDIGGLLPPQHIAQIMDIINPSRPVVATANRVDLSTGTLTWPKITSRPRVRVQATEKTETSSQRMGVDMESAQADTYLGAGNLSWQAINWSTPAALDLFFRLCAEAYAIQTEAAACHVLAKAAATSSGNLTLDGSDTFQDWLTAIVSGVNDVYTATNAIPNTLYVSPDAFFYAAVVTSDSRAMLINAGSVNLTALSGTVAGLRVVTSKGFATGTAIVGDSSALLVGETPGAPVELRAVEPAIGGLEVGVIGAFKAISFDDDRFADIGAAT